MVAAHTPEDVNAAAHALLAVISAHGGPPVRTVRAFQHAWNGSGYPGSYQLPHLDVDGSYGPLTAHALGLVVAQWSSQAAEGFGPYAPPAASSPDVSGFEVSGGYATGAFGIHVDLGNIVHGVEHVLTHPGQDVNDIARQAAWDVQHPEHAAQDVVREAGQIRDAVRPIGDAYLSIAQSVVSLIPGIGQGVSAAIGAAQAILDGGGALDIALRTAYGMIPIPPGLRQVTDPIFDAILALVDGKNITDIALQVARDRVPAGLPRDVFDTLARVVAKRLPIHHDAPAMREHMQASYSGPSGHAAATARGMARHIPTIAANHLRRLPPSSTRYPGVARPAPPAPRAPGAPGAPVVSLAPAAPSNRPAPPHRPAPPAASVET